jgi:putative drug exporter of the RND superfamily
MEAGTASRVLALGQRVAASTAAHAHDHHRIRLLIGGILLIALIVAAGYAWRRIRRHREETRSAEAAADHTGSGSRSTGAAESSSAGPAGQGAPGLAGSNRTALAPAQRDPEQRSLLYRLGWWSARHRSLVVVLWLLVLGGAAAGSQALGGVYSDNFALPGTSAQRGADLLQAHRPSVGGQNGSLVFAVSSGTLSPHRAAVEEAMTRVRALPDVLAASDPLTRGAVAPDGRVAYATVHFAVNPQSLGPSYMTRVGAAVAPARSGGVSVNYGGQLGQAAKLKDRDPRSEEIGIVAAILVLLLGFGSVVAAGLPVVSALAGAFAGLSGLGMLAAATTFPTVSPTLAIMMGLGVGIDYALFLTTRHRQLVMDGVPPDEAAARSLAASGRAVLVAALTVVIAMLGLYASGITFIGKLGLAASVTVAVAALSAITVVPALLAFAGQRIDRVRVRRPVAEASAEHAGWARYAERLGAHPWPYLVGGVALLAVLAVPAFSMRLGHIDAGADPSGSTAKTAYEELSAGFGPGANGPMTVVAKLGPAMTAAAGNPHAAASRQRLASQVHAALAAAPDVAAVSQVKATPDGALLYATVLPGTGPQAAATDQLMHVLQDDTLPDVLNASGSTGYVTGSLAGQLQFRDVLSSRLPYVIAAVILAAFVLLLAAFRSPVLAAKAAVLNLLSIGAAWGVVVAVFQWGWGSSLLGVSEKVPIESYAPMMIFAIVFGLSMDYEVFLLSRVREAWLRTSDNRQSVASGLARTARVITCAAAIMVCVFAAFLLSANVVVKMLALGLGLAVLIDASVIRLVVVPTAMFVLGRYNWWAPRWLAGRSLQPAPSHKAPPDPAPHHSPAYEPPLPEDHPFNSSPQRTTTQGTTG